MLFMAVGTVAISISKTCTDFHTIPVDTVVSIVMGGIKIISCKCWKVQNSVISILRALNRWLYVKGFAIVKNNLNIIWLKELW